MSFYGWKFFTLSHHFVMLGGHWFSEIVDMMYELKIK